MGSILFWVSFMQLMSIHADSQWLYYSAIFISPWAKVRQPCPYGPDSHEEMLWPVYSSHLYFSGFPPGSFLVLSSEKVISLVSCLSDAPVSLLTGLQQLVWNVTHPSILRTGIQVYRPGSQDFFLERRETQWCSPLQEKSLWKRCQNRPY